MMTTNKILDYNSFLVEMYCTESILEDKQLDGKSSAVQYFRDNLKEIKDKRWFDAQKLVIVVSTVLALLTLPEMLKIETETPGSSNLVSAIKTAYVQLQNKSSYGNFSEFLKKFAEVESNNKWDTISKSGMIGKYQIAPITLKDLGKEHIDTLSFREDPNIYPEEEQDSDILKIISRKKGALKPYRKYIGKTLAGIKITESGLIAASLLVGEGKVIEFLKSNGTVIPADGNGTLITKYLLDFQKFNIKK